MNFPKDKRGLTLVETIIYTALLSVVVAGAAGLMLNISDLKVRHLAMRDVIASGRWINISLKKAVREASGISVPAPGAASSTLEMIISGNPVKYYVDNSILYQQTGSDMPLALSPDYLNVSNILFTRNSGGRVDNINYTVDIGTGKAGAYGHSLELGSSVSIRN
jgi:hypothetical protein